jgi:hypothetical protein
VDAGSQSKGVLILDWTTLWTWWPTGKPLFSPTEPMSMTMYMKQEAPVGRHSIGHAVVYLGAIAMGTEETGGQRCDVIEVSIMEHKRSGYLWLSQADHLPRKLREVERVDKEITATETWSNVKLNAPIPLSTYR